jgi:hypothetical protein
MKLANEATHAADTPAAHAEGNRSAGASHFECGPIRIDPVVDRVWVFGERRDAVRGELYVLLKFLLSNPRRSIKWLDLDRCLDKFRSPAAHRKMTQRLRAALGNARDFVQTIPGGLRVAPPAGERRRRHERD